MHISDVDVIGFKLQLKSGLSSTTGSVLVITIPMYFHITYDREDGRKYICDIEGDSCEYIQNSVRVLNEGFRGKSDNTMFPQNSHGGYLDTKIQFCLGEHTSYEHDGSVCET